VILNKKNNINSKIKNNSFNKPNYHNNSRPLFRISRLIYNNSNNNNHNNHNLKKHNNNHN
jgi:hypothetical protein